jgi:hypothetical protein
MSRLSEQRGMTKARPVVARAWSTADTPSAAIDELMAGITGCDPALLAVFVSSSLPYDEIVRSLASAYPDARLVGCTTAGSLTPSTYEADGALVVAFDRHSFSFEVCLMADLKDYSMAEGGDAIEAAYSQLLRQLEPERENFFAMLLVDGLSRREEEIVFSAYAALDEVPIFGASAGDNLSFTTTQIFLDGQVLEDSALVIIGASDRRLEVFKCEHFRPTDCKMVVTDAEPERRIVRSINAEPAAQEYARLIGIEPEELSPEHYAANPLLVRIAGEYHIRAVQKVDEDDALHFYCAIDKGSVLTLAHPEDMRENLIQNMERLVERLGGLEITLCFDCILRRLEAERLEIKPDLLTIFDRYNMVGFNTYGEQYRFLHLSQTLTGLAIGSRP